jgi:hypothetical protein
MDLVTAFGPVFAAGFAVQQLLEILDQIFLAPLFSSTEAAKNKKMIYSLISLVIGLVLAGTVPNLDVLKILLGTGYSAGYFVPDVIITGLVISAGTEGVNSILKFLGYAKADKQAAAAKSQQEATASASAGMSLMAKR